MIKLLFLSSERVEFLSPVLVGLGIQTVSKGYHQMTLVGKEFNFTYYCQENEQSLIYETCRKADMKLKLHQEFSQFNGNI